MKRFVLAMPFAITALRAEARTTIASAKSTRAVETKGCRKCGIAKRSGKRSCCIAGGAWFKNCGDPGDSMFDHTWFQGVDVCKRSKFVCPYNKMRA